VLDSGFVEGGGPIAPFAEAIEGFALVDGLLEAGFFAEVVTLVRGGLVCMLSLVLDLDVKDGLFALLEGVGDTIVDRRSEDVVVPLVAAPVGRLEVVELIVDGRDDSRPVIDPLSSSPDVRPSWSELFLEIVAGRRAVVVLAEGLVGGLLKLLPRPDRTEEVVDFGIVVEAVFVAVVEVTGRFGAAPATSGFFGGTFSLVGAELIGGFRSCVEPLSIAGDSATDVSTMGLMPVACSSAMVCLHVKCG